MSYTVEVTQDAKDDLIDIYDYINEHDLPGKADDVLDNIETMVSHLADNPHRGAYPNELLALGIKEYREIYFTKYRIIYRVIEHTVYVMLVADGRRDMAALLERRLFNA